MKAITIVAAAIMLLPACKKDMVANKAATKKQAVTSATSTDAQTAGTKTHTVKVKGTIKGTNTVVPSNVCGPGVPLFVGKGTGVSSHSGSFTWAYSDCATAPHQDVDTYANGDKIFFTQTAQAVDPATGLVYQDYILTGGTGRFEGATGSNRVYFTKRDCTTYPVCILEGYIDGTMTTVH